MTTHSLSVPTPRPVTRPDVEMGDAPGTPNAIELTDRYVTRNGQPWFPVMGEYHFSRDDAARWETELRKIQAGGIDVLATYIFWILHEEVEGNVRWDGNRDLRRFLQIAHEVGLTVVIRIGPWAHGEARNGGFPDWVQARAIELRTNDPEYLALVRHWYTEVERQLRGLFHTAANPDGPIIAVQVDNELYDQPDHIDTLRAIAEDVGMHASLWVATGWGGALLPADRVMPVYAGYSDGFWESSQVDWPDFGPMHFSFSTVRDDLSVGADVRGTDAVAADRDYRYPFVTCELGGGMHVAYHRRPHVDPIDVSALGLVKIGSGSAWQGYYLYHGVQHVIGELTPTQESHDTGYPNDLSLLDYDFYAPLGALGQVREHYHLLRQQHLLLQSFGAQIATYPAVIPPGAPGDPRWSVRGDGQRGYLFVNNHQPAGQPMPALSDVQFAVELGTATVTLPSTPIELASGTHFVWPLRQTFGGIPAVSATLQPVTAIGSLVVFAAIAGIEPELLLEGVDAATVSGATVEVLGDGALLVRPVAAPGIETIVTVGSTRLLILDPHTASRLWRGEINGVDSLVVWDGALAFGDELTLFPTAPLSELLVDPPLNAGSLPLGVNAAGTRGGFNRYGVSGPDARPDAAIVVEKDATGVAEHRRGGNSDRSSAPLDVDYQRAAQVRIVIPELSDLHESDQVYVSLEWVGDAARAYIGYEFVSDQFWSGRRWDIDLSPHRSTADLHIDVRALPWDPTADVHVDPRVRPQATSPLLHFTAANVVVTRAVRFQARVERESDD
jgi:beta-galactosidase